MVAREKRASPRKSQGMMFGSLAKPGFPNVARTAVTGEPSRGKPCNRPSNVHWILFPLGIGFTESYRSEMADTLERLQAPWSNKDRKQRRGVLLLRLDWNALSCGCKLRTLWYFNTK